MKTRMVSVPSDRSYVNFARGPYLLAAVDPANRLLRAEDVSGSSRASELRPLFEIDKEPYHIYFRR
ncbi:MAG: hypothetical protein E7220_01285 [Clostridiales bacterium]|nr:hypothetical protein [Clostridiales bacterium]